MTASAGRTRPGAAACPAWPSGSPWSTGAWTSPARPAGRPRSPSSFRCAPGTADAHRDRRGRRAVPRRAGEGPQVCAEVADGEALLAAAASQRPDVVVADIRMPPTFTDEGLRAALELRRTHPGTAVLVLSQYIETRYAAQLLHGSPAGVGYLLKDRGADVAEFTDAVGRV